MTVGPRPRPWPRPLSKRWEVGRTVPHRGRTEASVPRTGEEAWRTRWGREVAAPTLETGRAHDAPLFTDLQEVRSHGAEGRVVVDRCQGVQVGDHNVQVNSYEFDVRRVDVELDRVLVRRDVRAALSRLAADPENATLRARADDVLGAGPLFAHHPQVRTRVKPVVARTGSTGLWNAVVVRDSQGVQISENAWQENLFVYVTTAELDGRQLLRDSPELRESLIASCCGQEATGGDASVRESLKLAIEDAVSHSGVVRDRGVQVEPSPRCTVVIQDAQGVSVGRSHQQSSVKVDVRPTAVSDPDPDHVAPSDG